MPSFTLARDRDALRLTGTLTLASSAELWEAVQQAAAPVREGETLNLDLSEAERIDGGALALLVHLRANLLHRGAQSEFVGGNERVQELVHLYGGDVDPKPRKKRRAIGTLEQIGRATTGLLNELKLVLDFIGQSVMATIGVAKQPRSANWRDVPHLMEKAGADALPIVLLINFLVGFVMAFQGAGQLKQFGANIFVADLVGISVTRELAPLMTAIIIAGRSGAAFAAEIGTMRVSEEVDALRTLGFGPIGYLVLPRVVALVLMAPILTLLADFIGVLGGMLVGVTSLDLTIRGYLIETRTAVAGWDVASGILKSLVFASAIALISCQQGFATSGGAEGVGRRTTASVVSILFALILVDAAFTVFFYEFHL